MYIDDLTKRELNALIAEGVMGWPPEFHGFDGQRLTIRGTERGEFRFNPSEDIADAWAVVEKMGAGWAVKLEYWSGWDEEPWSVQLDKTQSWSAPVRVWGETAPIAICRAALRAMSQ